MKGCRPLTDAEVRRVLDELSRTKYPLRNQALFLLGLRSGFRISEILSLRVGDVLQNGNFVDRVLVERKHMKKKTEGRSVPLHVEAKNAVQAWVEELARNPATAAAETCLFQSRQGVNRSIDRRRAWRILRNAYAKCGLTGKLGTHSMRKTFAKRVYEKLGKDLVKTQRALGHSRITSTVSYLSFNEEDVDDAILKS